MTLKLKTLGLALIACLALSAVVASAASAGTAYVTGDPDPNITGADSKAEGAKTELTGLAGIKCKVATYAGTAVVSTITITPSFSQCEASTGAKVTVTINNCAYKLTLGGPLAGIKAPVKTVELECPAGQAIEVHLYLNAAHTIPTCTINIGPQTPTSGISIEDNKDGTLTVSGAATNIMSTLSGSCLTGAPFNRPDHKAIANPFASTLHTDIILGTGLGLATEE